MNVLMIDSEMTWRGGETQVDLLMRGLVARGIEVALVAPDGSAIAEKATQANIPVHFLPLSGGFDVASAWRLRQILARTPFDIIHSHTSHAHSVAYLATRALPSRPRLIVSRRVDFPVAQHLLSRLKYTHGADLYLAISNGVIDVLTACGVPPEKIEHVPSGIDLGKFQRIKDNTYLRSEFELDDDTLVIGNIAALARHKAQEVIIRAAGIVAGAFDQSKFIIVGEGKRRRFLESLVQNTGMKDRIIFTGFREDSLEILSTFNCFVLSSILEGLCTSIMDAQGMGVPVVATRTGGVPDIVEDGVTGLLTPPEDHEALARAIILMLEDEKLRCGCVKRAKENSLGYDHKKMVEKTMRAYEKVVG